MSKKNFGYIVQHSYRKIVIHHTFCFDDIIHYLNDNDLVFFDDCLYSQYVFIKDNIKQLQDKNINCVIGFSSDIYRRVGLPIYEANCAEYHDKIYANDVDAYRAYMSIDEIFELLKFNNIYLACHGAKHINLEAINNSKLDKMKCFIDDLALAKQQFKDLKLSTTIFVYPRAYDRFPLADKIVKDAGFCHIFAGQNSKRIQIEDLVAGNENNYNGI